VGYIAYAAIGVTIVTQSQNLKRGVWTFIILSVETTVILALLAFFFSNGFISTSVSPSTPTQCATSTCQPAAVPSATIDSAQLGTYVAQEMTASAPPKVSPSPTLVPLKIISVQYHDNGNGKEGECGDYSPVVTWTGAASRPVVRWLKYTIPQDGSLESVPYRPASPENPLDVPSAGNLLNKADLFARKCNSTKCRDEVIIIDIETNSVSNIATLTCP
jgi:hypothetical protein